jgi:predicted enzyme related to lactoylglutathione lyase
MKKLKSACIITQDVRRLCNFYQSVLDITVECNDIYAAFPTPGAELSIFSAQGMEEMAPGSMDNVGGGSTILEFEVEDVDREYERLKALKVAVVKPPTTQPWGIRSVWFRDPDGNKVNFFAHVSNEQ